MNFIEALEFLVENTTDDLIKLHGERLLKRIKFNMEQKESKVNPYAHSSGMSDKVIVKVLRGGNDVELN